MAKTQAESDMSNPQEVFAWMFAAGVPDPRDKGEGKYRNQPLIPPQCYGALSQMLWDFGCRFVPEAQTKWIKAADGPLKNFSVGELTDKPDELLQHAAAVVAEQFPEVAAEVAAVQPGDHAKALKEFEGRILDSVSRLREARARMDGGS